MTTLPCFSTHGCIYPCLQIPPRENWFQYVRRVYTTAINFQILAINDLVLIDFVEDVTGKYGEEEELVSCGICDQIDPPHEDLPLDKVEVEWVGCDCFR